MNKSDLPSNQKDAVGLLLQDHREVKRLFKEFQHAKSAQDKEPLAREICAKLTVHTQLEEELFYPMLRETDAQTFGKMVNEASVEHGVAKELIGQIEGMSPDDALFEARVTVLCEYVNHHVGEEEDEIFPKLAQMKTDLRELGEQMEARKQALSATAGAT